MENKDKKELSQKDLGQVAGGSHQSRPSTGGLAGGLAGGLVDKFAGPLSLVEIESVPELAGLLKSGLASGGANETLALAAERIKRLADEQFGVKLADDAALAFVRKARELT